MNARLSLILSGVPMALAVALLASCSVETPDPVATDRVAPTARVEAGRATGSVDTGGPAGGSGLNASQVAGTVGAASMAPPRPGRTGGAIASYPDRGDLVGYDGVRTAQRHGAHTYFPVRVSEEHALAAIGSGHLKLTAPDGHPVELEYERHVEHSNGDWSWIGRNAQGVDAILTFGEQAVFGVLPGGERQSLRLTTNGGQAWMVATAAGMLSPLQQRRQQGLMARDILVPTMSDEAFTTEPMSAEAMAAEEVGVQSAAAAAAGTTIDLLLGYTSGFANMLGGTQQAGTRLNHLVTVSNQTFSNSNVAVTLRLVGTLQVNYTDGGSNETALTQVTGSDGSNEVSIPSSLAPLRAARETLGADLVSLVRRFRDPEHEGCGIAWLIGGDETAITQAYQKFAYSVISDSNGMQAPDNDHYCRDETLVHEIGHNMGSQHDESEATGEDGTSYGRYPYSFGYKTGASEGNFHTVMAYGDAGQTAYRTFSNPQSTFCGGRACGVANRADNARSLRATAPLIANFRSVAINYSGPHLYAIKRNGRTSTEAHILNGSHGYARFSRQLSTVLARTGDGYGWVFRTADYNDDGVEDLYAIKKNGGSGKTEIHVLNGASNYRTFLLQTTTVIHSTGFDNRWLFDVADYNGDGKPDLYAIKRMGGSGKTEIHILNGASRFKNYLLQTATAVARTGDDLGWKFEVGDYNDDGKLDLYGIKRNGGNGRTEVHILNGASRFKTYLLQTSTALGSTGRQNNWEFKVADYDGDGRADLYAIEKDAPSATTVHIMSASSRFKGFLLQRETALGPLGTSSAWQFDLVGP